MPPLRYLVSLLWFYLGLAICVLGYALVIRPGLGAAPWDIFHLGVAGQLGISLGYIVQGTGAAIIGLNLLLGIKPSVGTVLNMLSMGPVLQWLLTVLPAPDFVPARWLMFFSGILLAGLGTALYVSAGLGSGPRDGMMIGLTRKLGLPVGVIKNGIDLTVALAGWWLGGPLGLGTVVVALTLGPSVQLGVWLTARLADYPPFDRFVQPVTLQKRKAPEPAQQAG